MKKFLLIGAAILIAGAATVAVAADHKGGPKRAAHTTGAPAKTVKVVPEAHKKTPPAKHHGKRHHRTHHARSTHHRK